MADDRFTDARDESTPVSQEAPSDQHAQKHRGALNNQDGEVPGGAELANSHLPDPNSESAVRDGDQPADPELTDSVPLDDDEDTDGYVDDPDTEDVNEAKLERATDEVADEPVSAVASRKRNRATKPVRRVAAQDRPGETTTKSVARKGEATRKRSAAERKHRDKPERTGPVKFVNEAVGELRKVVWPTGNQVQQYFVVVLVFVLFIIAFVSLLDLGFGWVILRVFG